MVQKSDETWVQHELCLFDAVKKAKNNRISGKILHAEKQLKALLSQKLAVTMSPSLGFALTLKYLAAIALRTFQTSKSLERSGKY